MSIAETQTQPVVPQVSTQRVRTESLLLLGSAVVILALGAVLTAYVRGQSLLPGELATTRWLSSLDSAVVLAISEFLDVISNFDVAPVLFAILVPIVWFLWGRPAVILFGISGSLTGVTRIINLADRARPTEDLRFEEIVTEAGIYPSGHVVYGVLVFGMLAYLAYKHMRPGIGRTSLIVFLTAIAILMGPSRVIELDHWPADTVGSYLLSIPFLLILIWLDRHPMSQPGGRIYRLAQGVDRATLGRVFPGRH